MNKFSDWLSKKYGHRNIVGIENIGYCIEYLQEVYGVKDFEFYDMNVFSIYDMLIEEIRKRQERNG